MTLRPKKGESYLYEKSVRVLGAEAKQFPAGEFVLFTLQMPDDYNLVGLDNPVVVAVPIEACEEP